MTDNPSWPANAELPELTDDQKAEQREALDMAARMGSSAAMRTYTMLTGSEGLGYFRLAPVTRTCAEFRRGLAFLIAHGLVTVADPSAFERWFSTGYEIPEHLDDPETLRDAFARGF